VVVKAADVKQSGDPSSKGGRGLRSELGRWSRDAVSRNAFTALRVSRGNSSIAELPETTCYRSYSLFKLAKQQTDPQERDLHHLTSYHHGQQHHLVERR